MGGGYTDTPFPRAVSPHLTAATGSKAEFSTRGEDLKRAGSGGGGVKVKPSEVQAYKTEESEGRLGG